MRKRSPLLLRAYAMAVAATAAAEPKQSLYDSMTASRESTWPNRYDSEQLPTHPRDRAHASQEEKRQRRRARHGVYDNDETKDSRQQYHRPSPSDRFRRRNNADEDVTVTGEDDDWSDKLRSDLLSSYNHRTYPWHHAWKESGWTPPTNGTTNTTTPREGLRVEVGINFHRVVSVDIVRSVADVLIWFRLVWSDPRLAWNPDDYGGLTSAFFWIAGGSGPGGETSEIWTPDLELWNQEESLTESLVDAHAHVDFTGKVFWSRPGHLRPVCKFQGLNDFPFDKLSCTAEIGSWAYTGLYVRPVKWEGVGYSIGGSETAGEAYAEYSLKAVACDEHVYLPQDWPVLFYRITFHRAWQPYARGYLVLQIILNLAAFSCFWLPPHCGERMGLAITAMLAAVASELLIAANLPSASEVTWFATFSMVSLWFAALSLFESAAVIYFHYHTGDDLTPRWAKWIWRKCGTGMNKCRNKGGGGGSDDNVSGDTKLQSGKGGFVSPTNENSDTPDTSSNKLSNDAEATAQKVQETSPLRSVRFQEELEGIEIRGSNVVENRDDHPPIGDSMPQNTPSQDVPIDRRSIMSRKSIDSSSPLDSSFVRFQQSLSKSTRTTLKTVLGRDADDFKNAKEMENNIRWQKVAVLLDEISRVLFPLSFAMALAILLGPMDIS